MAASGRSPIYDLPYPLSGDIVDVSGDIQLLSLKLDSTLDEVIQDVVGLMVSAGNSETGITVSYDDSSAKLNFALDPNYVKDTAAQMLDHQDHIGISATYNSVDNQLTLEVVGGGGGGGGGTGSASLTDIWWLGV